MLERIYRFFFFSSRRRHTRLQGDWSSDVCSSDLGFQCLVRGLYELFRRQRFVDGVAEIYLGGKGGAGIIGLEMSIGNDPGRNTLGHAVTAMVTDSRGDPREEPFEGAGALGFSLFKPLARDLNVEILRAREPKW